MRTASNNVDHFDSLDEVNDISHLFSMSMSIGLAFWFLSINVLEMRLGFMSPLDFWMQVDWPRLFFLFLLREQF